MAQQEFPSLVPPKRESLLDALASQIKTLILPEHTIVGDELPPERELADLMGVSRAVVGEAPKSLEQLGLIEISFSI